MTMAMNDGNERQCNGYWKTNKGTTSNRRPTILIIILFFSHHFSTDHLLAAELQQPPLLTLIAAELCQQPEEPFLRQVTDVQNIFKETSAVEGGERIFGKVVKIGKTGNGK